MKTSNTDDEATLILIESLFLKLVVNENIGSHDKSLLALLKIHPHIVNLTSRIEALIHGEYTEPSKLCSSCGIEASKRYDHYWCRNCHNEF